jgi:hypothetical protein
MVFTTLTASLDSLTIDLDVVGAVASDQGLVIPAGGMFEVSPAVAERGVSQLNYEYAVIQGNSTWIAPANLASDPAVTGTLAIRSGVLNTPGTFQLQLTVSTKDTPTITSVVSATFTIIGLPSGGTFSAPVTEAVALDTEHPFQALFAGWTAPGSSAALLYVVRTLSSTGESRVVSPRGPDRARSFPLAGSSDGSVRDVTLRGFVVEPVTGASVLAGEVSVQVRPIVVSQGEEASAAADILEGKAAQSIASGDIEAANSAVDQAVSFISASAEGTGKSPAQERQLQEARNTALGQITALFEASEVSTETVENTVSQLSTLIASLDTGSSQPVSSELEVQTATSTADTLEAVTKQLATLNEAPSQETVVSTLNTVVLTLQALFGSGVTEQLSRVLRGGRGDMRTLGATPTEDAALTDKLLTSVRDVVRSTLRGTARNRDPVTFTADGVHVAAVRRSLDVAAGSSIESPDRDVSITFPTSLSADTSPCGYLSQLLVSFDVNPYAWNTQQSIHSVVATAELLDCAGAPLSFDVADDSTVNVTLSRLDADLAVCSTWDEATLNWTSTGVSTLSGGDGGSSITCGTTRFSAFAAAEPTPTPSPAPSPGPSTAPSPAPGTNDGLEGWEVAAIVLGVLFGGASVFALVMFTSNRRSRSDASKAYHAALVDSEAPSATRDYGAVASASEPAAAAEQEKRDMDADALEFDFDDLAAMTTDTVDELPGSVEEPASALGTPRSSGGSESDLSDTHATGPTQVRATASDSDAGLHVV